MPVTCSTTSLADESACYTCLSPRVKQAVRILLLCNFINGETMNCSAESLVEAALEAGYDRFPPNQGDAVELYLLCTLANTGGGGGGATNLNGAGSPVGVVTPTVVNQFYRDTTNNTLWQSTGLTDQDWINWV